MVDLQGVKRNGGFALTDPAIHRSEKLIKYIFKIKYSLSSFLSVTMEALEKLTKKSKVSTNTSRLTFVTMSADSSDWTNTNRTEC